MDNKICSLLGIQYPIIQGGMAWIAESSLAAAVSNAGGIGIIAGGNAPPDFVRGEIRKARNMTKKPIGLNIMLLSPFVEDIVRVACEEKVEVVTTGAGNAGKYLPAFKENNIKVIPVVPSVALAKRLEKSGVDAIIAEGMESGGHIGKLTTMTLVPQVVDAVSIPVIAAGGIGDGRGMLAAFALGAQGVQIGTRFLVAKECCVHDNYKKAVLKAKDIDTTITGQMTSHPIRLLRNRLTRAFDELEKQQAKLDNPDLSKFDDLGKGALQKAVEGDSDFGSLMCGQIAGLVKKEQTCKEIIDELIVQYKEALSLMPSGCL